MKLFYRLVGNMQRDITFPLIFLVRKLVEQTVVPHKDNWLHDTFSLMDTLNATSSDEKWTREKLYRV